MLKITCSVLNEIQDKDKLIQDIKSRQRIFKVAPDYDSMISLVKGGLGSSYAITQMGRDSFVKKYSISLGGVVEAERVYRNASVSSLVEINRLSLLQEYEERRQRGTAEVPSTERTVTTFTFPGPATIRSVTSKSGECEVRVSVPGRMVIDYERVRKSVNKEEE